MTTTPSRPVRAITEMPGPLVERYLIEGKFADGETALRAQLRSHHDDNQARFGLGVLQFLQAVQRLAQDFHRYGLRQHVAMGLRLPILRLPVPSNDNPEVLSYGKAREIAKTFMDNLALADQTLAEISDPNVKLPLHFGLIRMDLSGDGREDEEENLWKLWANLSGNTSLKEQEAQQFYISFDQGDVHWLRGYCHLLKAVCEIYLAHDSRETFDCTAHIFFAKVESPYKFLSGGTQANAIKGDGAEILDLIALIHTINWTVIEPYRMKSALEDLQITVAQSKEMWKSIMAETDDDHEWIPNPRQTGVIPGVQVTDEMVASWTKMMSEIEKLLAGEVLIPFWRGREPVGINLNKVFTQPEKLDLVLWVQGPGAAPYLEQGTMTDPETWRELPHAFGSEFPGFAIWFN